MDMKIATVNYTYGGEAVSISCGNKEDGNYLEDSLNSDSLLNVDQRLPKTNSRIREFIEENGITHVEDRYYSARTGIYLCPAQDYLIELDSYL